MGVLKTIFFILIFYYAFKYLAKLFAPYLVKKAAETIQKKAEEQFKGQQAQQEKSTVKEGETIIDKAPRNNSKTNGSVGEYVDFEEID
ncbi:DUF4834 family protein [Polaribacter sp.]|uniref:DUF4834 family protein n=1 Tax=Polaribacter sp. TaxID=1920175 RepID=UPI003EF1795A